MIVLLGCVLFWLGFRLVGAVCVLMGVWGETVEDKLVSEEQKKAEYKKFVENVWLPWLTEHKGEMGTLDYVRYRFGFMFLTLEEMQKIMRSENAK